jgi:hypothetical protein
LLVDLGFLTFLPTRQVAVVAVQAVLVKHVRVIRVAMAV